MRRSTWIWLLAGLLLLSAAAGLYARQRLTQERQIEAKLALIAPVRHDSRVNCAELLQRKPLLLLALGQSNAGNHGSPGPASMEPIAMVSGPDCLFAKDPLPGATGRGGSIWSRLPAVLSPALGGRQIVMSVLAVDASPIADWTRADSPIVKRLKAQIEALNDVGLRPDLVLWQQGEADARLRTEAENYLAGLRRLATLLEQAGVSAPLMLARSTVCRSEPNREIQNAIDAALALGPRFVAGPDTDALVGIDGRFDGCHFNARGLDRAADAWSDKISAQLSKPR
ncbi:MAG: hypothetical protein IV092_07225 [Burkholderiaceae bacterium]|nr:hypothetical protein [Burkholderiaceae bacterium]